MVTVDGVARAEHEAASGQGRYRLTLLGGWRIRDGETALHLPGSAQRLIALVGLTDQASRAFAAGTLWPEVPEHRAHASLRSTIWRVSHMCPGLLVTAAGSVGLSPDVAVDVLELKSLFEAMLWHPENSVERGAWVGSLGGDLLPGWDEEWVLLERERLRQMRVHALEMIARDLANERRYAEALEIGMVALSVAPLRESAHREIIRIHLAEGNHAEALRQFEVCAQLLRADLGLEPSELMIDLMAPVIGR